MDGSNKNIELSGNNDDNHSIFDNLTDPSSHDPFFHKYEVQNRYQSSDNNSNYLNFVPTFERQPSNQATDRSSIFDEKSLFFPPFDNPQRFPMLGDKTDGSQKQYQHYSTDTTSLTTKDGSHDSNETSLVALLQKAISNPEEKNALMKLFRQINVVENEDRPTEAQNQPQFKQSVDSYQNHPLVSGKSQECYVYPNQPQNPQTNSYEDITQSHFKSITTNELAYVSTAKYETFNGSNVPNYGRKGFDRIHSPDSETFETVPQSSDSQYADSRSHENCSDSSSVEKRYVSYGKNQKTRELRKPSYEESSKKVSRRNSSMNVTTHSDTSSFKENRCRRKSRNIFNNLIDVNTIPSLFTKFQKYAGTLRLKNILQPDLYHRARYLTEGSRTTLRDVSGTSYPTVKLAGYDGEGARLHVFIGAEGNTVTPSLFYQISRASFKNSTSPREITVDGINVLEYNLSPEQNMTAILDGIGILKLRNSDVEHRFGVKTRKKTSKCCLAYRALVPYGGLGYNVVQTRSNLITCVQPMGNPEITKVIPSSAFPGNELAIIGKNFLKNAFVLFFDSIIEADNSSGKKYSWSVQAVIDSDLSTPMHIVCKVPFYPEEYARANGSKNLNVLVRCNNRSSQPTSFLYKNPNCTN